MSAMTRTVLAAAACAALALPASALADDIQPVQAQEIQPVGSTPVEPVGSTPVQPVGSTPVEPVGSDPVQPVGPGGTPQSDQPSAETKPVRWFLGAWRTRVPGTTYETDNGTSVSQTTSTGTGFGNKLVIRRNGTYRWKGHTGRWSRTGNAGYPIVLRRVKPINGRDWAVGFDGRRGIYIADGSTWYEGRR